MTTQDTIDYTAKIGQLRELCDLQYDELGELWEMIIQLWNRQDYFLSPEFLPAILREIDAQLDNIEKNAKIEVIEKTETRTYKHLRWKEDCNDYD